MKKSLLSQAIMLASFGASVPSLARQSDRAAFDDHGPSVMNVDPRGYAVVQSGQSEELAQRLYDYQLYPTAGQQQLTFFQNGVGQGLTSTPGAVAGTAKQYSDTNMTGQGSMPNGTSYLIEGIEVYFWPGSVNTANTFTPSDVTTSATGALNAANVAGLNDINRIYSEGLLTLTVLNKIQVRETPLRTFPPCNWMELDAAAATTVAATNTFASVLRPKGEAYSMVPVFLESMMNFNVTLDWPAARPTPSGFNGRIGVVFNGKYYRAAQ